MGSLAVVFIFVWASAVSLIRFTTGLDFIASEFLSSCICLALLAAAVRYQGKSWYHSLWVTDGRLLWSGGVAVFTAAALWGSGYSGMPSVGGGDAGNHAAILLSFISEQPKISIGFTGFHSLAALLMQALDISIFQAFRALLYLSWIAFSVISLVRWSPISRPLPIWEQIALVIIWASGFYFISGPTFSYLQADGFFYHWMSIVLAVFGLRAYAMAQTVGTMWLGIGGLLFAMRGIYGLNLADFFVGFAWVLFSNVGSQVKGRTRGILYFLAAASLFAAGLGYWQLFLLLAAKGSMQSIRFQESIKALLIVGLFLSWISILERSKKHDADQWLLRLSSITAFLVLVPGFLASFVWVSPLPKNYYFHKYHVLPQAVGWVVLFVVAREHRLANARRSAMIVLLLSIALLSSSLKNWYPAFRERIFRNESSVLNVPLSEPQLESWMRSQLKKHSCHFAGYVTLSWPRYSWMVSSFGVADSQHLNPHYEKFTQNAWIPDVNGCVFFEGEAAQGEVLECFQSASIGIARVCSARTEKYKVNEGLKRIGTKSG